MDYSAYENTLTHPYKINYLTRHWYKGGKLIATKVGTEAPKVLVNGVPLESCTMEKVHDEKAYNVALDAYNKETARLMKRFEADFFAELGIENHPKRHMLFNKAWERGHADGYAEVMNVGWDLVELIRD